MFAVIETGGKQYKVIAGQKLKVEKLEAEIGSILKLDKVLLKAEGDKVEIGAPYLVDGFCEAKVLNQDRHDKKIVFRYHSKTRYRKKNTHRQPFTEIEITNINN